MTNVKKNFYRHLQIFQIKYAYKINIARNFIMFTVKENAFQNIQKTFKTDKLADLIIIQKNMKTIDVKK